MEDVKTEINKEQVAKDSTIKNAGFVNPVLKELARLNGKVNRMSVLELQHNLKYYNLDPRGRKDVLKSRLKAYYKKKKLSTANIKDPNGIIYYYKFLIIIDFEATCDVGQPSNYRQEIIEFPALLFDTEEKRIVDEFHSYVRPIVNPKLTTFCTTLTGITQDVVNNAPFFVQVLNMFRQWLMEHNLKSSSNTNFIVVSDGPWDMGRFLVQQCRISNIDVPEWGTRWINIRKTYSNFYDTRRVCLKDMLMRLGMNFEGQPHSGIDDARNIARIIEMLMRDGANLRENEGLEEKDGSLSVVNITRKSFEEMKGNISKKPKGKETKKHDQTHNKQLSPSINDYLLCLDPPLPNLTESDFPLLAVQSNLSAMNLQ